MAGLEGAASFCGGAAGLPDSGEAGSGFAGSCLACSGAALSVSLSVGGAAP